VRVDNALVNVVVPPDANLQTTCHKVLKYSYKTQSNLQTKFKAGKVSPAIRSPHLRGLRGGDRGWS
jgi:hypothetical protein